MSPLLRCTQCGVTADAKCGCGVGYVPAGKRAEEAVKANPGKSDRAHAADLGVGKDTVRRARTGADAPAEKRTGRDGRTRKLPVAKPAKSVDINAFHQEVLLFLKDFQQRFGRWRETTPLIDQDGKKALTQAFFLCADGFQKLAQQLDDR